MKNGVNQVAAASPDEALRHFDNKFRFETDCWDVHEALAGSDPGFVLVDARSHEMYRQGHLPAAISLPHGKLTQASLRAFPHDTLFVVYCAGPHCNGADKAARRLAELGRPVKLMIGGVTGWLDEGFELVSDPSMDPASH